MCCNCHLYVFIISSSTYVQYLQTVNFLKPTETSDYKLLTFELKDCRAVGGGVFKQYHGIQFLVFPKGKAIHLQAWTGSERFQEAEIPIFQDNLHMKVVRFQPYVPAAFTPQEIFLVLISVRGESTPGL
jgi:hypothetical protein